MKRLARWVLVAAAALAVLAVVAAVALPYVVDTPRIQSYIATAATQALGRPVRFASVSVSLFPLPAVVLDDLEVAEDPAFGKNPFVLVDRAVVRLKLWPLLRLRVELGDFILKEPGVSLVRLADGRWNIATLGAARGEAEPRPAPGRPRSGAGTGVPAPAAGAVLASRIKIDDGVVSLELRGDGRPGRLRVEDVDVIVTARGDGALAFHGKALLRPSDVQVQITDGVLEVGGARTLMDAPLRARVAVTGSQLRELVAVFAGPEPAIGAGVKAALTLAGTLGQPRAEGDITLTEAAVTRTSPQCPAPRQRTLAFGPVQIAVSWKDSTFTGPVTTSIRGGTIATTLRASLPDGARVEAREIAVRGVPVEAVLVDFLCQSFAVSGPLELTGTAATLGANPLGALDGSGRFRIGPGRVVGAQAVALLDQALRVGGAVSSALRGEAPVVGGAQLDYESITGTYRITNGVVRTPDLTLVSRALQLRAAGTYTLTTGALDFDTVLRYGEGGELRAKVTGTTSAPSIRVAPPTGLSELDAGKIQRGFEDLLRRFR